MPKPVKVKLLTARSGDRFSQSAGEVIEVSPDVAKRMVDRGHAVRVQKGKELDDDPPPPIETEMIVPPLPPSPGPIVNQMPMPSQNAALRT